MGKPCVAYQRPCRDSLLVDIQSIVQGLFTVVRATKHGLQKPLCMQWSVRVVVWANMEIVHDSYPYNLTDFNSGSHDHYNVLQVTTFHRGL